MRAQQAQDVILFRVKIEHTVHHMLQNLRSGQFAVLGNVAQYKGNNALGFTQAHQFAGTLAHLRHRTGGGGKFRVVNRLNRIQNQHFGIDLFHGLHNFLDIRFTQQENIVAIYF